jgi:hypothetical protein
MITSIDITVPSSKNYGDIVIPMTIRGGPCMAEDLSMAIVKFAKEWKESHRYTSVKIPRKPCGCKGAK